MPNFEQKPPESLQLPLTNGIKRCLEKNKGFSRDQTLYLKMDKIVFSVILSNMTVFVRNIRLASHPALRIVNPNTIPIDQEDLYG